MHRNFSSLFTNDDEITWLVWERETRGRSRFVPMVEVDVGETRRLLFLLVAQIYLQVFYIYPAY